MQQNYTTHTPHDKQSYAPSKLEIAPYSSNMVDPLSKYEFLPKQEFESKAFHFLPNHHIQKWISWPYNSKTHPTKKLDHICLHWNILGNHETSVRWLSRLQNHNKHPPSLPSHHDTNILQSMEAHNGSSTRLKSVCKSPSHIHMSYDLVYFPHMCSMNTLAMNSRLITRTGTGPTLIPGESSV